MDQKKSFHINHGYCINTIFQDPLVAAAFQNSGSIRVNNLTFMLPEHFGFCKGVKKALQLVDQAEKKLASKGCCYILGEIIHNPGVNLFLKNQGIKIIPEDSLENIFKIAGPDDQIVISAFGVDKELTQKLTEKFPHTLVDAACPNVKKVWNFVADQGKDKRTIILYGKPNHAEIKATVSRALTPENSVIVIQDTQQCIALCSMISDFFKNHLKNIPLDNQSLINGFKTFNITVHNPGFLDFTRLSLANQTTMLYSKTLEIEQHLKHTIKGKGSIVTSNTICRATQIRQDSALELCKKNPHIIIVAGGYESSNTASLYRLARAYKKTWFVENSKCIEKIGITHFIPEKNSVVTTKDWFLPEYTKIGILAGASCPAVTVGNIIRKIAALFSLASCSKSCSKSCSASKMPLHQL
jgi:4-hydroxy-3-methylbut-2-enyl diphosphate reductase